MKEISFISFKAAYHANKLATIYGHHFFSLSRIEGHIKKRGWKSKNRILFIVGGYNKANGYRKEEILPLYHRLANAHSKTIVTFAGSDILHVEGMTNSYKKQYKGFLQRSDVTVAAVGDYMAEEVREALGFSAEVLYMPFNHNLDVTPADLPNKFTVGCYMPHSGVNFYGYDIILEAIKKMPDVEFHFYSLKGFAPNAEEAKIKNLVCHKDPVTDMSSFINKMSCGLRITQHDGNPMSLAEYNAMGRYFIFNKEMPFSFCVKDNSPESIIEQVLIAKEAATKLNSGIDFYRTRHNSDAFFRAVQRLGR